MRPSKANRASLAVGFLAMGCAPGAMPPAVDAAPDRDADPHPLDAAVDAGHDPPIGRALSARSFGVDFWVSQPDDWRGVLGVFQEDSFPIGLVGLQVTWAHLEPLPPSQGEHEFAWSNVDPLLLALEESGAELELALLPSSTWATLVSHADSPPESRCCAMSPPRDDAECRDAFGTTCWQAWRDFVGSAIERYDGDGVDDAPGVTRPLIRIVSVGDEPEVPSHFSDYGGTPQIYARLLQETYEAVKAASPSVVVARGRTNPGNAFDDAPDPTTAALRLGVRAEFLETSIALSAGSFDAFAINFNDDYSGLGPFAAWVRNLLEQSGAPRPLFVADARTTPMPRDNDGAVHVLPPRYAPGFATRLADPLDPDRGAILPGYRADEALHTVRKITTAFAFEMLSISLQPAFQAWAPPTEIWREAGLFDYDAVVENGDWRAGREPAYYAVRQLTMLLDGATLLPALPDLGAHVHGLRVERGAAESLVLWHEDPFDVDASGLVRRGQSVTVDLGSWAIRDEVHVTPFITEVDPDGGSIVPADRIVPSDVVEIDERPVVISLTP